MKRELHDRPLDLRQRLGVDLETLPEILWRVCGFDDVFWPQGQPLQRMASTRDSGCLVPIRTGTPFPWQGAQWQALTSFWNSSRARFMFCFTVLEKEKSVAVTSSYRGSAWEGRRGIDCNRQHLSDRSVQQGRTGNGQGSVHGDQSGFTWNWINATACGWTPHRLSVPPNIYK